MLLLVISIVLGIIGITTYLFKERIISSIEIWIFLVLLSLSVYHAGMDGVVLAVKIALMYGAFIFAKNQPNVILSITGIAIIAQSFFLIEETGLNKEASLPSIGLILIAASLYEKSRSFSMILIFVSILMSLFNYLLIEYRTQFVLIIAIFAVWVAFQSKLKIIGRGIIFLPILLSSVLFFIGLQFAYAPTIAQLAGYSIEATASNFERTFFSYAIINALFENPFGQSVEIGSYALQSTALSVGRSFYEAEQLDPHNFFLFFSLAYGFVGASIFLLIIWKVFRFEASTAPVLSAILIATASVSSSLFPFSVEPRLVVAACLGAYISKARPSHLRNDS